MTRVEIYEAEFLKTGDTEPDLTLRLIKDNGTPKDLSEIDSARIVLSQPDTPENVIDVDTTGDLLIGGSTGDGLNGFMEYSWSAEDTAIPTTLVGEVVVYNGPNQTEPEHFPNQGYFEVYIEEGLI